MPRIARWLARGAILFLATNAARAEEPMAGGLAERVIKFPDDWSFLRWGKGPAVHEFPATLDRSVPAPEAPAPGQAGKPAPRVG